MPLLSIAAVALCTSEGKVPSSPVTPTLVGPDRSLPWMVATDPVDTRVEKLLDAMSEDEMQAQTIHLTGGIMTEVKRQYGHTGLGAYPAGGGSLLAVQAQNDVQACFINTSRLSIPVTFHTETLHSGGMGSTIFPMPVTQGSTWNTALVHAVGAANARQARANGVDRGFSPEINENFGEDPALVAAMGVAAVLGLHANNTGGPSTYLNATIAIVSEAKHAAAYGLGGKDGAAADLSPRTLHDVYLRPWREYMANGGRGAMLSHNSINDVPAHANSNLMTMLRNWSVGGGGILLASDMCDVGLLAHPFDSASGFGVAADMEGACALSMTAGMDQELCNPTDGRGQAFPLATAAIKSGALSPTALRRAAGNVLRSKFAAGLFDRPFADVTKASLALLDNPADRALSRQVAAEGAVLLQNFPDPRGLRKPTLPLKLSAGMTVAIVGPLADSPEAAVGGYSPPIVNNVVTVLKAAASALPSGVHFVHSKGADVTGNSTSGFADAVTAAKLADVVVAVVGDSGDNGWDMPTCGEDDDRTVLDLPGVQPELLSAIAAAAPTTPIVAVLVHGRPVTFVRGQLQPKLSAILAAWRPGEEGGNAIWDLLLGSISPSGRLTQAWPRSAGYVHSQASPWFHKRQGDFDESPYRGGTSQQPGLKQNYPWGPLFPFQFGLSYTTFTAELHGVGGAVSVAPSGSVAFDVAVTNTGTVSGKAVVGVYYRKPMSEFVRWHRMMATLGKTATLNAGETENLPIDIDVSRMLASYDPAIGQPRVESGLYIVEVVLNMDPTASHDPAVLSSSFNLTVTSS